jgi:hypothetical protein
LSKNMEKDGRKRENGNKMTWNETLEVMDHAR